jgi:hypothetical protein
MIQIGHEASRARRERRTARNPRYAPEFLERRLHPTAGVTSAVAAYYGQVATDPNPPGTPLPHPPYPPEPGLPPIDVPLPPIEPALPW